MSKRWRSFERSSGLVKLVSLAMKRNEEEFFAYSSIPCLWMFNSSIVSFRALLSSPNISERYWCLVMIPTRFSSMAAFLLSSPKEKRIQGMFLSPTVTSSQLIGQMTEYP